MIEATGKVAGPVSQGPGASDGQAQSNGGTESMCL